MTLWILRMIEEQFHRDDEDRLLREGRAPKQLIRPGEIDYKPCPYPGSRFQHACPMNVSALRQMSAHWDDILDALAVMRVAYTEQRGEHAPELMDLWRVGQLGSALPWFYILRGGGMPTPAYAAALSKITLGVGIWAQRLLVDWLAGTWTPVPLTPQAIYASTESNGTLLGEHEVCSGPEKMMLRFFEVLVGGQPAHGNAAITSAPPSAALRGPAEPGLAITSAPPAAALRGPAKPGLAIARLAAETDRAMLFGAHYANFKLLLWIHFLARRFVYADLAAAFGPDHVLAPALAELVEGGCEPPDFFVVGPPDHAAVPPAQRGVWMGKLAALVLPIAPDRSDLALQAAALGIGLSLAQPPAAGEVAAEVARVHGVSPDAAALAGRALATYARLDALLREIATTVEDAFRRSDPTAAPAPPVDRAARDRLLLTPPRAVLARIAPEALDRLTPP